MSTKIYSWTWLIALSFLVRVITVFIFGEMDTNLYSSNVNEWHILSDNLIKYKTYSFYVFDGQAIPSVFMPPLYAFCIYFLKISNSFEIINLLYLLVFIQIILSTYSVYLFYQLNKNFFSNKVSLLSALIFSIIPLNIYACGQVSSITVQVTLSLFFLTFLIEIIKKGTSKNIILFSVFSGLLILTRGEFILIYALIIFFLFIYKKISLHNSFKILAITLIIISPYIARNYIQFNKIFLVKSLGYNLWKGNNQLSNVEGYSNLENDQFLNLKISLENLQKDKMYELRRDKLFLTEGIKNLNNDLGKYSKLFFIKVFSFYFIDLSSKYQNYYNLFHIIPILIISSLSFFGLFTFYKNNKFEKGIIGFYLLSNLIIFSIFFILPRYNLIILPVQIILATHFVTSIIKKYEFK